MPYIDTDDGHRITISGDLISHARQVFEQGLQLEAILIAHEYLEQRLNRLYNQQARAGSPAVHRRLKNLIDLMSSEGLLSSEGYQILNEFNRLRNVNANQMLNSSLTLLGAKKGDLTKAMDLAAESDNLISILADGNGKKARKKRKGG